MQRLPVTCLLTHAYCCEIPAFASDARCLLRVISLLDGLTEEKEAAALIPATLTTLSRYARFQFEREERVMVAFDYCGLEAHRAEHRGLLALLSRKRSRSPRTSALAYARKLHDELLAWFWHHTLLQHVALFSEIDDLEKAERIARLGAADCLIDLAATAVPRAASPPRKVPAEERIAAHA